MSIEAQASPAEAMHRVLTDADLQQDLRRRGLGRAAGFACERTARETMAVYEAMLHHQPWE